METIKKPTKIIPQHACSKLSSSKIVSNIKISNKYRFHNLYIEYVWCESNNKITSSLKINTSHVIYNRTLENLDTFWRNIQCLLSKKIVLF